ncbi:MAG: hypothetical protein ABSB32_16925 [Thermodesulfobacteriota bacterium]
MKIIPEYGIVAFFDILGYRNLILNNKIETTASIALEIINKIPLFVRSYVLTAIPRADAQEIASDILNHMSWRMFSDTIFNCLSLEKDGIKALNIMKWGIFLASCLSLQRYSFDEGLPLRGAISTGYYFLKDNCFIGQPVIEAYDLCQEQDWAGGALTEKTGRELNHILGKTQAKKAAYNIDNFLSLYPVPMKDGRNVTLLCFRWGGARNLLSIPPLFDYKGSEGLNEYVAGRFQAHSKGSPSNLKSKIDNTKKFLQFIKSTYNP